MSSGSAKGRGSPLSQHVERSSLALKLALFSCRGRPARACRGCLTRDYRAYPAIGFDWLRFGHARIDMCPLSFYHYNAYIRWSRPKSASFCAAGAAPPISKHTRRLASFFQPASFRMPSFAFRISRRGLAIGFVFSSGRDGARSQRPSGASRLETGD